MKKVNESSRAPIPPLDNGNDDLLPHYNFSGGVRGKHAHWFYEGAKLEINGAPFIVKGRSVIPDPAAKKIDNGKRPRAKK